MYSQINKTMHRARASSTELSTINGSLASRAEELELSHWGLGMYNHRMGGGLTNPKSITGYQRVAMALGRHTSTNFQDDSIAHLGVVVHVFYYTLIYWYILVFILAVFIIYLLNGFKTCRERFLLSSDTNHKYKMLNQSETEMNTI